MAKFVTRLDSSICQALRPDHPVALAAAFAATFIGNRACLRRVGPLPDEIPVPAREAQRLGQGSGIRRRRISLRGALGQTPRRGRPVRKGFRQPCFKSGRGCETAPGMRQTEGVGFCPRLLPGVCGVPGHRADKRILGDEGSHSSQTATLRRCQGDLEGTGRFSSIRHKAIAGCPNKHC